MPQTTNFHSWIRTFLFPAFQPEPAQLISVNHRFQTQLVLGACNENAVMPCGLCPCPALPRTPASPSLAEKLLLLLPDSKDWSKDPGAQISCWELLREEEEGQECRRWAMERGNDSAETPLCRSLSVLFLPSFCFVMPKSDPFKYWFSICNAINSRHCPLQVIWVFIPLHRSQGQRHHYIICSDLLQNRVKRPFLRCLNNSILLNDTFFLLFPISKMPWIEICHNSSEIFPQIMLCTMEVMLLISRQTQFRFSFHLPVS